MADRDFEGPVQPKSQVNLSPINEQSWRYAVGEVVGEQGLSTGHSVIKITPNSYLYGAGRISINEPIIGNMLNKVSFSITSEWSDSQLLGMPLNKIKGYGTGQGFSELAGGGTLGSRWLSKKVWKKSGDLSISPTFRVVDWNGDGAPIKAAILAAQYCLPGPQGKNQLVVQLEKMLQFAIEWVSQTANSEFQKWKTSDDEYKKKTAGLLEGIFTATGIRGSNIDTISKNILEDIHDVITLKQAPPPVKVQIGQYFYHPDMIVESVTYDFSKEVSPSGPLHVDIAMGLRTRKILGGMEDVGLTSYQNLQKRASIVQGGSFDDVENFNKNVEKFSKLLKNPGKIETGDGVWRDAGANSKPNNKFGGGSSLSSY